MTSHLKEEVIALIKKLPDDTTIDDIMYHLYVKKKLLAGLKSLEEEKAIPHEEVMETAKKRLQKGLK